MRAVDESQPHDHTKGVNQPSPDFLSQWGFISPK